MRTRSAHQKGCILKRKYQGRMVFRGKYRDEAGVQQFTEPLDAKTKAEAQRLLEDVLRPINERLAARAKSSNMTVAAFVTNIFIPFKEADWKESTAANDKDRIRFHITEGELGETAIRKLDRHTLQKFLNDRVHLSQSVIDHLRFAWGDILRLAKREKLVDDNFSDVLKTPREARVRAQQKPKLVLTLEQSRAAIQVLDMRERIFVQLCVIAGMRPGEVACLTWDDIKGEKAEVRRRVYRCKVNTVKNEKPREIWLSPSIRRNLELWREFRRADEQYIFGSERGTPGNYNNIWRRKIHPRWEKIGLGWANYLVLRRSNATLLDDLGADPKSAAAQRGHDIGVSIREYTQVTMAAKAAAVSRLEAALGF